MRKVIKKLFKRPTASKAVAKKTAAKKAPPKKNVAKKNSPKKSSTKPSPKTSTKKTAMKKPSPQKPSSKKTAPKKSTTPEVTDEEYDERALSLLPPDYEPSESEEYMNSMQLEYFRRKLVAWKESLLQESQETLGHLQNESISEADIIDRAVQESSHALELRTRDRYRKLIIKIDEALNRIADNSYGYCLDTGKPIGIRRLQVRPIATLCLEAQEAHERKERLS